MQVQRQQRVRLRAIYQVTVRVRCDRCARVLGELYGDLGEPAEFTTTAVAGILPRGGRIDYFRCRCGAAPVVRDDKLTAAYRTKAARPPGRGRDLWLLADLRG